MNHDTIRDVMDCGADGAGVVESFCNEQCACASGTCLFFTKFYKASKILFPHSCHY